MDTLFLEKYGSWAIVTGASSGIGVEFAQQLASKGMNLVLVARRKPMLENLARQLTENFKIECKVIEADLGKDGFQFDILDTTKNLEIGLLINNAGMNCEGQ